MQDEALLRIVDRVYDSILSPEDHGLVLDEVMRVTNSHFMVLSAHRPNSPIQPLFAGDMTSRRLDGLAEYAAGAFATDPTAHFANKCPQGGLFATDHQIDRDQHAAHPHVKWNRHYLGNSHWTARFDVRDGMMFGVSVHSRSPDEPHAEDDRARFEMLFGHMARAWRVAGRKADLESHRGAVMLLNGAGWVKGMSPAGQAMVESGQGFRVLQGELLPQDSRCRTPWREAVWRVSLPTGPDEEAMLIPHGDDRRPLAVTISAVLQTHAFGARARDILVRVVDRDAAAADMSRQLGNLWSLTPAEARLAQTLLDEDFALRRTAARLGIAYSTVRTQLASIFAKTETTSQPELTRLLARLSG